MKRGEPSRSSDKSDNIEKLHKVSPMRKLIIVRHSVSQLDAKIPPGKWKLTDEGRKLCHPLAQKIFPHNPDVIITSSERKAQETGVIIANLLNLPYKIGNNLHELVRESGKLLSKKIFEEHVSNLFSNPDQHIYGIETANEALIRFSSAVDDLMKSIPEKTPAIITHGMCMSLYYGEISGKNSYQFWKNLGIPSFYTVIWPAGVIESVMRQIDQI